MSLRGAKRRDNLVHFQPVMRLLRFARNDRTRLSFGAIFLGQDTSLWAILLCRRGHVALKVIILAMLGIIPGMTKNTHFLVF